MSLCGATIQVPCLSANLAQSLQIMKLPDPQRALTRDVLSSVTSAANTEKRMQNEQQPTPKLKKESYAKFIDGEKTEIAKRAAEQG